MKTDTLIENLKKCDESSANEFLQQYRPLIRYTISPFLKTEQDIEDCISDVVLKIWKNIQQFDSSRGNFTAWITVISRNTAINQAKKQVATENIDDLHNKLVSPEPTPEEALINKEQQKVLMSAINSLSFKDRTLFYRKYYYMQSTSQIACETGLTERAVEGRLYRIKKRLRKILGGELFE